MAVACFRGLVLAIAVMASVAAGRAVAEAPSVAGMFQREVADFADIAVAPHIWIGDESPWAPYLGTQFGEGSSDDDCARAVAAGRFGQCEIVLSLEQKGFLALYPDLRLAFSDDEAVRTSFAEHVVPQVSFAHRRCVAWRALVPIIEDAKRAYAVGIGDSVFLNLPRVTALYPPRDTATDRARAYHRSLRELLTLALCEEHPPSVRDVIELHIDERIPTVGYAGLWYLRQIALDHGIDVDALTARMDLYPAVGLESSPVHRDTASGRVFVEPASNPSEVLAALCGL